MRIPLSWLKEHLDIQAPPAQIAKILTQIGIEVDSIETSPLAFQKVVVGRVISAQKHPFADKLQVAIVSDGNQEYQVVCGAANCRAGIKTAFAMIGATIKEESGKVFTIKKSKIRDVESFGMLCAAEELQLGGQSEGIMEFADHVAEGADVSEMYADTVMEVSLTPNLGHCLSIFGIARELSAATGIPLKDSRKARAPGETNLEHKLPNGIRIVRQEESGCPRYACCVIKDVKIGPSPEWLQKRLTACGLRPINNIVDATNYVLMELGQPLHAFDLDNAGKEIIVRKAHGEEVLITLDGKERKLHDSDLLICSPERPLALAGIMGGKEAEVGEHTQNLLIESAYFSPSSIRRTSKRLGLQTDASKRFERFVDPNQVVYALEEAAHLICLLSGGHMEGGLVDDKKEEFPCKKVECRLSRANQLLGTLLSVGEIEDIWRKLGFHFDWDGHDLFSITVPTYRADISLEVDLIEEIARIYGYDNIAAKKTRYHASSIPHAPIYSFEKRVRNYMLAEGLQEFLTCDLIGPAALDLLEEGSLPSEAMIQILNPTSIEQSILRTSLLPGLLQVVKYNNDHQVRAIHGFEIGRVHFKQKEQFKEQSVAGIILSGSAFPEHWDQEPRDYDFFDLKGILENFLAGMRVKNVEFFPHHLPLFHPQRQASLRVGSLEIGSFGEVHPAIQRRLDVPQKIYFAELNLHDLFSVCTKEEKMSALPVYPASERDWTVTLKEETPIGLVQGILQQTNSRLLESVQFTAVYRSEKIGVDQKNATFHFVYRDRKKTVAQETVDAEHARIIDQTKNKIANL